MVFFLSADDKVYARYGGRDERSADSRQSYAGLNYTMKSVLAMHQEKSPSFAPRLDSRPRTTRDLPGRGGRCLHCHNVREAMNRKLISDGEWSRDLVYRFPLPENIGVRLEVDRGNVVERIAVGSPAARIGLKKGDVLKQLGDIPIHSFADAQLALDRAPIKGELPVVWKRGSKESSATVTLVQGWRKTDITWRPSLHRLVPALPVSGTDLSVEEKKALGLSEKLLAFKQRVPVSEKGKAAGIQAGDIILGIEGQPCEMTAQAFAAFVRREYLVGDRITLSVRRDDKPMKIEITLANR